MKAGDVSGGQTSSRESWLSAPLSDPNAALWASITPPANRDIVTLVRRRAAAFSLDLLAQRLFLRFPERFASRATARIAILSAAVAAGAALGSAGYLSLKSQLSAPVAATAAVVASAREGVATTPGSEPARRGQTQLAAPAHDAVSPAATTLAATAPSRAPEQIVQPLRAAPAAADETDPSVTSPKAKRGAAKKRTKAAARRAAKRRARAALD